MSHLSYTELKSIVWSFADKIRDQGKGEIQDYMPITIGTLILKRIIDERAYYKRSILEDIKNKSETSGVITTLDEYVRRRQKQKMELAVKSSALWTWRLEWKDISKYIDNSSGNCQNRLYTDYGDVIDSGVQAYPKYIFTTDEEHPEGVYKHPTDHNGKEILNKVDLVHFLTENFEEKVYADLFRIFDFTAKIGSEQNEKIVLDSHVYGEILSELENYDFSVSSAPHHVFADVYMNLLERFAHDGGKKGGEYFTPQLLVEGAVKFLRVDKNMHSINICDITSGACSGVIEIANSFVKGLTGEALADKKNGVHIITGEKNMRSGVIGRTNVVLHGYEHHKHYDNNSITEYNGNLEEYKGKINYAFANPPYGLSDYGVDSIDKTSDVWQYGIPKKGDGDYAFMEIMLSMLSPKGQAVIILPMGTLFKNTTKSIRQKILETGWVEGIVALPSKLFRTTSIPVCIWVINKNRQDYHLLPAEENAIPGVMLINATNDFEVNGKYNDWIDKYSDHAYEIFEAKRDIEGYSRYVDFKTIEENDFNLSIDKYIDTDEPEEVIDIDELEEDISKLQNKLFGDLISLTKTFMSARD